MQTRRTVSADYVIIGGGITSAMVAQKLSDLKPSASIVIVEAGSPLFDNDNRFQYRQRSLDYGENQWPGDFVPDQAPEGMISRTMAVGGSALHWGGVCNRFSEEDTRLKSMYGLSTDWPIEWADLEKFYCEAERRVGVSGEPSPLKEDWRSQPYPMPAMTPTYNLKQLKTWAEKSGIPFWTTPQAKNTIEGYGGRSKCHRCNTCEVCPTGARSNELESARIIQWCPSTARKPIKNSPSYNCAISGMLTPVCGSTWLAIERPISWPIISPPTRTASAASCSTKPSEMPIRISRPA